MSKKFYFIAIGGTGMASVAGLLKAAGHRVCGSDTGLYPPMSDLLARMAIPVYETYDCENIESEKPDFVVVGNILTPGKNVELDYAIKNGCSLLSFPQVVSRFLLGEQKSLVVAGTHGKTSTVAILAHILEKSQCHYSLLVGGIIKKLDSSFKYDPDGEYFAIEGDEYDTAYFDKEPKFFHYRPHGLIITNIEYDHADIYDSIDAIKEKFVCLVKTVDPEGVIVANRDDALVMDVCKHARARVLTYGKSSEANFTISNCQFSATQSQFEGPHSRLYKTSLAGEHNIMNTAAVILLVESLAISDIECDTFADFNNVKRRLEVVGSVDNITVIDDFAHHPTAVATTIDGLRKKSSGARIWAVFDPRNATSRRNIFFDEYREAFQSADVVIIGKVHADTRVPENERFDASGLAKDLGPKAFNYNDSQEIVDHIIREANSGDQILVMSCGGFENLHQRVLEGLSLR